VLECMYISMYMYFFIFRGFVWDIIYLFIHLSVDHFIS